MPTSTCRPGGGPMKRSSPRAKRFSKESETSTSIARPVTAKTGSRSRPAGPPRWPAVARLRQRPLPKMAPRRVGNNRSMRGVLKIVLVVAGLLFVGTAVAYAQLPEPRSHEFPYLGNRGAVWIVAQLHILFAAFILGAPIFVVVSEILGWK